MKEVIIKSETNTYTLYNEDCLVAMDYLIENNIKVDAIITDPPFGTTLCKWDSIIPFDEMWKRLKALRVASAAIVLFGSEPFSSYLRVSNIKEFKYDWVWQKSKSGSAFTAKYRPVNKHEMISVFGKGVIKYYPQLVPGKAYSRNLIMSDSSTNNHGVSFNKKHVKTVNNGFRYPITVQMFQQKWRRQDQLHPTQKPVALMEYLVKTYTNENDTVLDFTMGSGTTGVACANLNRNFIGIENVTKYFDIAVNRIQNACSKLQLF